MKGKGKTLAWAILSHKKMRLLVSVTGIAFAVLLMFVEIGFLNGLLDSETLMANKLDADLIMINRMKTYAYALNPFPRAYLARTRGIEGVDRVTGLYMHWLELKNTRDKKIHAIMGLGVDPGVSALLIPEVNAQSRSLAYPYTALFDRTSRMELYGDLAPGMDVEVNGRRLRLRGSFKLYPNFSTDGHLMMGRDTLSRLVEGDTGSTPLINTPEMGLITLSGGADPLKVKQKLEGSLPGDVAVFTKEEMVTRIKDKWKSDQPVVAVFGLGLTVGFAIGMIICYQILFTEISDHSAEFATLKAIGYTDGYLIRTVMTQGLYLALVSFGPGLGVS